MRFLKHYILPLLVVCCSLKAAAQDSSIVEKVVQSVPDAQRTVLTYSEVEKVTAPSAINRTFEKGYKSKYAEKAFRYEEFVEGEPLHQRIKRYIKEFVNDLFKSAGSSVDSSFVDVLIFLVVVVLISFLIFFIFKAIINKEGKWIFSKNEKELEGEFGEEVLHIAADDYKSLIEKATSKGDYRLATRYYFMWVLKHLDQTKHIEFKADKTARDYESEIKDLSIKEAYTYARYLYDNVWYGERTITVADYRIAQSFFNKLINEHA